MDKGNKKGIDFEGNVVSYFQSQGYLAKNGIPIVSDTKQDATDIDVFGIKFLHPFIEIKAVCDCKNKNRPKPHERIFWTKGMATYVGVDNIYVALPKVSLDVERFAKKIGINILTEDKIEKQSCALYSFGNINEKEMKLSDKDEQKNIQSFYRDIKHSYLSANPYVTLNNIFSRLTTAIKKITLLEQSKSDALVYWKYAVYELIVLLSVTLLRICSDLQTLDESQRDTFVNTKLTYGELNASKTINIINAISQLANEIIKSKLGNTENNVIDLNIIDAPPYVSDIIGLLNRMIDKPEWYLELPQMLNFILYNLGENNIISLNDFSKVFGTELVSEKIKACKNILALIFNYFKYEIAFVVNDTNSSEV